MQKIAVVGAGTMGAGIAAQLANNDCKVVLFDLTKDNELIAANAIKRLHNSSPAALIHPNKAEFITPASINSDLHLLEGCDLVIEAIIEDLSIKHDFYFKAAPYLSKDTILASNTSTFQLKQLKANLPLDLAARIVICHFFNPPRYMRLLELVTDETLSSDKKQKLISFLTNIAGKVVINCKDTPGFIANRIGCFLLELAIKYAADYKVNIAKIDYIFSKYLGFPSTGIFGLYDLIGLDVMQLISKSLVHNLPTDDLYSKIFKPSQHLEELIIQGYKGRKGLGGFYRMIKSDKGEKIKEVLSFENWQYQPLEKIVLPYKSLHEFLTEDKELGGVIAKIITEFYWYVLTIANEISNNFCDIDKVMQLGYSWKNGPFILMQQTIGFDWLIAQFKVNNLPIPEFIHENLHNAINLQTYNIQTDALQSLIIDCKLLPLISNESAKLWQLKSDKLCFEITTKSLTLNEEVFKLLSKAIDFAEQKNATLILYSDYKYFCAGGDLTIFLKQAMNKDTAASERLIALGQEVFYQLKYSKAPIVSCARGFALGGGCELLLQSQYIVAHQDLITGLVEARLGLIPGWGGFKEMIMRANNLSELKKNLNLIFRQFKSQSALDFADHFKQERVISIANSDNLLEYVLNNDFKRLNLQQTITLDYEIDSLSLTEESYSEDVNSIAQLIENRIKKEGNKLTEKQVLKLEKEIFIELIARETTPNKIRQVIEK